ncbi:MAG: glycoside hydrolase family 99-like domain-containing protein [Hyphomonadaceae bacterium]|nr:glycoside hydrolase family 99-like domain-containing protein [Hyphomonadaceae bacterium]
MLSLVRALNSPARLGSVRRRLLLIGAHGQRARVSGWRALWRLSRAFTSHVHAIRSRAPPSLVAVYRLLRSAAATLRNGATGFRLRRSHTNRRGAHGMLKAVRANHERDYDYMPLAAPAPISSPVRCIAFYRLQFQPIPENSERWGSGFTDWIDVGKALPEFIGHCQPHIPGELGYYDVRRKEIRRRQAALARQHGIFGFCYYYDWRGAQRLESPPRSVLEDTGTDFPFCLCWADEDGTPQRAGPDGETPVAQPPSAADDLAVIADLALYMRDHRYIRVDGRPLIVVQQPTRLPDPAATAGRWRRYCRQQGIGEVFLAATQAFDRTTPAAMGFDAAIDCAPNAGPECDGRCEIKPLDPAFAGKIFDYRALVERGLDHTPPGYPLFRSVCPGWDNTARQPGCGTIYAHATPAGYQEWLEEACAYTLQHFAGDARLVFVNAWNEWAEGAYLEPSRRHGYAYLNATAKALHNTTARRPSPRPDVAVIAHVYYEELWPEISDRLQDWDFPFVLHVTTTHDRCDRIAHAVHKDWPNAIVASASNRGRDMASFLQQARIAVDSGAEFLCKVHTKRSTHRADGAQWRKDLYSKILGDRQSTGSILQAFARNAALGIIAPEGHAVSGDTHWAANAERVLRLAARLGYRGDPRPFVFAAGSMFWARSEALQPILRLGLTPADFEEEAHQLDGTLAHALERLFSIAAKLEGYRLADTRVAASSRHWTTQLRSERELAVYEGLAATHQPWRRSRPRWPARGRGAMRAVNAARPCPGCT